MVIDTQFALIEDGLLYYRGRPAAELAGERFETVARWALTDRHDPAAVFETPTLELAHRAAAALPETASYRDRQLAAVTALAASDPLRTSREPDVVAAAAERIVATMAAVLSPAGDPRRGSVAERLWRGLSPRPPAPAELAALDAALILLIDHDIAVSTLAARAAASGRAGAAAVVTAGLGALDTPLHGTSSAAAHRMLTRALDGESPSRAVAAGVLETGGPVPGFGQPLYPDGDPRAVALLARVAPTRGGAAVIDAVDTLTAVVHERTGRRPNIDLALAALAVSGGMAADAGTAVFATARAVGWVVHALDEYTRPALRMRPTGRYTGR